MIMIFQKGRNSSCIVKSVPKDVPNWIWSSPLKSKNYWKQIFVTMKQMFTNVVWLSILWFANWEQSEYDTLLFHDRIINFDRDKTTYFVSEDRSLFNYWKKDRASIHVNLAVLISNATPIFPRRMDSVSKSGSLSSKFFPPSIRRHRPRGFFSDGFMYLFSPTKRLILSHIWEIIHDLAYKCQLFLSALSITPKQCSKS